MGCEPKGGVLRANLLHFFLNFDSEIVFELQRLSITKLTARFSNCFLFLAKPQSFSETQTALHSLNYHLFLELYCEMGFLNPYSHSWTTRKRHIKSNTTVMLFEIIVTDLKSTFLRAFHSCYLSWVTILSIFNPLKNKIMSNDRVPHLLYLAVLNVRGSAAWKGRENKLNEDSGWCHCY